VKQIRYSDCQGNYCRHSLIFCMLSHPMICQVSHLIAFGIFNHQI